MASSSPSSPAAIAAAACMLSSLASSHSSSASAFIIAVPPTPPMTMAPSANNLPSSSSSSSALRLYQEDGAPPYPPSVGGGAGSHFPSTNDDDDDDAAGVVDDDEIDFVGAGTLGDIMAGGVPPLAPSSSPFADGRRWRVLGAGDDDDDGPVLPIRDGLVTGEADGLVSRFGCDFSPMERIALTANGNLQRIFSSYYDAPVRVHVDRCSRRRRRRGGGGGDCDGDGDDGDGDGDGDAVWDRVVRIQVRGVYVCRATSVIRVRCSKCRTLIEEGTVGIAQMFRHLNRLPTFSLLDAGRRTAEGTEGGGGRRGSAGDGRAEREQNGEDGPSLRDDDDDDDKLFGLGGVWRTYELRSEEMTCLIHEEFRRDAWHIL
ncbi:hypothetical protein ACHAW5_005145 [Stephanodiscus triporus]|uniref:BED-type domain-containing protein n=1 Tax=Stephanodiscus triporus TaxID=2934178 RepID=A0ABD3PZ65_9STRA